MQEEEEGVHQVSGEQVQCSAVQYSTVQCSTVQHLMCVESRVAVLENQNKALIEELKSLKELYTGVKLAIICPKWTNEVLDV